jgi:hypothetical protein
MLNVQSVNKLNEAISTRKFYGKCTPRSENGRCLEVRADVMLKTEEELAKFTDFVNSLAKNG